MDFQDYLVPGKTGLLIGIGGVSMSPLAEVLHGAGLDIRGSDMCESDNTLALRERGIPIHIGHSAANVTDDIEFVIRTAAVHDDNPEVHEAHRRGIPVFERAQAWGAIMHGYRNALCISGTHGKTTTTTLISEMLKAEGKTVWLGGNIGTPLLPLTRQMKETDLAVVELSSFQLMDMKRSPQRAVVTNLAPNHLDIHKDMQEYVDAKRNIFRYQDGSGLLVLNADNDITAAFRGNGTTRFFSRKGMAYVCIEDGVICRNGKPILPTKDILIPGVHNIENYMAAIAVVEGVGDHGCEYMTGGTVVVLGKTGKNFAAGMSGGIAYVLDEDWDFYQRVNKDMVSLEPVEHKYDVATLKELIREHVEATGSPRGKEILDNFSEFLPKFKKVLPYDYDRMLRVIASVEERGLDGEQAQIEAFYTVQKKK